MRERERREIPRAPEVRWVTARIVCDHCGNDIRPQLRSGDVQDVPGAFTADFKLKLDEVWSAELCADCTCLLRDFIDDGGGPGTQVHYHDPMGG